MKWCLTQSTNQFHCWNLEQDEYTAELKYNKKANSFRIAAGDKRLFFIEKAGFLQNKFLIRTEYSVIIGEIYPVRNWHSGMIAFENKKYNYRIKDNMLVLSYKKEDLSLVIEISDTANIDQSELYSLAFSTLRVLEKSYNFREEVVHAW